MRRFAILALAAGAALVPATATAQDRVVTDSPPPQAYDAMSSGIGERTQKLRQSLNEAVARGAISAERAAPISRGVASIESLLSWHLPRGYRERAKLRAQLDALESQLAGATHG
jgi:hypothetical protein